MSDVTATIDALYVYPVKSCAGLRVARRRLTPTGLESDRHWMVVTPEGEFLTQRSHPQMALVATDLDAAGNLTLVAPGRSPLAVPAGADSTSLTVRVWRDHLRALDAGDAAADWLSEVLGTPARLAAFAPDVHRPSNERWTQGHPAWAQFADGFALLVTTATAVDELNRHLAERGAAPVDMRRFRPNIVLAGLDPHEEDYLDTLTVATAGGPVVIKLVKPCTRCPVPNVDPDTGLPGHEPGDTLATYRNDARMDGAVTFGMNGIVIEGAGRWLREGDTVEADYTF